MSWAHLRSNPWITIASQRNWMHFGGAFAHRFVVGEGGGSPMRVRHYEAHRAAHARNSRLGGNKVAVHFQGSDGNQSVRSIDEADDGRKEQDAHQHVGTIPTSSELSGDLNNYKVRG